MRTTFFLNIIIACLAFAMSLFSIETPSFPYSGNSVCCSTSYKLVLTDNKGADQENLARSVEKYLRIDKVPADEKVPVGEEKAATAGTTAMTESFYYEMGDVRLSGEPGSLKENITLTIDGLDTNVLPPMNAGMVNVTADYAAYRMLPHGMIFNKDIEVVLPYDTALLPMGFTANDIMTYYYDEQFGRWIEIERDSVDMVNHLIISKVNHFTDFINAVIKTPEMPETSAYVPTTMSDIKVANPLEGVNLMQPPTANNNGTANMNYPIVIPAGRNGMQPNIALTYNSGGGNGWLGVGWDISIPAITVETRWGVPRYNTSLESEVYVLGGEQLVTKDSNENFNPMPHRTDVWQSRMLEGTQFYPRVNEVFDSIVRHGTNPTDYWWSVTDRNGRTNYYGKQHGTDAMDPGSVLRDANGNIAHWALTESVDPYGNNVRYYYDIVHDSGVPGSSNDGIQIYISNITYTGTNTEEGKYEVSFDRHHIKKTDISISGRYGFKEVSADMLCNIKVSFDDSIITAYVFRMENSINSLYKTRLRELIRIENLGNRNDYYRTLDTLCSNPYAEVSNIAMKSITCININSNYGLIRYRFEYYDRPEVDSLFGPEVEIDSLADDEIQSDFVTGIFNGNGQGHATALGGTKGKSFSLGGTISLGIDPNVCMTSLSVGGNFDYSRSGSEGLLTNIDLDGDGLADKVFKSNDGKIYFRKRISDGETQFYYGPAHELTGISNFLKENSSTPTWGLQASAGLSLSGGWPTTTSTTSIYFSDVNADGLPDLITDKGTYFNDLVGDIPTFTSCYTLMAENSGSTHPDYITIPSTSTCGGIIYSGEVNDSIACSVTWVFDDIIYDVHDSIYTSRDSIMYAYVDSLVNTGEYSYELKPIGGDFYNIYIYRKEKTCEHELLDPDMDAVKVWVAPMNGEIRIDSDIQLLEDTSESRRQSRYANGIRYTVQHNFGNSSVSGTNYFNSYLVNEMFAGVIPEEDYSMHHWDTTIHVIENDVLFFRLQSNGDRSFDKVDWEQTITYVYGTGALDEYEKSEDRYNSKEDFLVTGDDYFQAYREGDIHITGTVHAGNFYMGSLYTYLYLIMLKNNGTFYYLHIAPNSSYDIDQYLHVSANDNIRFFLYKIDSQSTTWSEIQFSPKIEYASQFPIAPNSMTYVTDTLAYYPSVQITSIEGLENYKGYWLDSLYHHLFGPLYRGWGQFTYNNNMDTTSSITDPIYVSCLKIDPAILLGDTSGINNVPPTDDRSQAALTSGFESNNMYYPLANNTRWGAMYPNSRYQAWSGYGNINYITKDMMTNMRMVEYSSSEIEEEIEEYDHPVPVSPGENLQVKTIRKVNKSKLENYSCNLTIPTTPISIGGSLSDGNNTIITDYMDLNGDRYPDILGETKVQYSDPWGGIGSQATDLPSNVQQVSFSATYSDGTTFGASYCMPKRGTSNNQKTAKISFDGQGSIGGSLGSGNDRAKESWMDMNGDGLPDKVIEDKNVVLNMGYSFLPVENWNHGYVRTGSSHNAGLSISPGNFNIAQASIGGGMSINKSENETDMMLMDMNGDGLPDKVSKSGGGLSVKYNLGNGTWSPIENIPLSKISYGSSFSESGNVGVTLGFTFFSILKFNIGVQTAPYNRTFSKDSVQLTDINGDGYVDYVTSSAEDVMRVRYNQTGRTNLLKKVTNFTGSEIVLDYQMPMSSFEQPQRSWVMSSVQTEDPYTPVGGAVTLTSFEYLNPHYDRYERIAYGYDTVVTRQYDTENGDVLYRYTVEGYNNYNFNKRGKKKSETTFDGDGHPYIEKLYDMVLADMHDGHIIGDSACPANAYPLYEAELVNYYEGDNHPHLTTAKSFTYDKRRNVIQYVNRGDTAIDSDNLYADIKYKQGMGYNLIALADSMVAYDYHHNILRKRGASYNNLGKTTQIRQYNYNTVSRIDLEYDNLGSVDKITFPPNSNNQRMYYEYVYDPVVYTYPVTVSSALGYYSTATYDYRFGKPLVTTDINGNEMHYSYDCMGRATYITAPYELSSGAPYTISMQYHPFLWGNIPYPYQVGFHFSYAYTYHYDRQHPSNPIRTTTICDGFGRMLQTKKDAEIAGQEVSIVSGKVEYDAFGRTVRQYHPVTETLASSSYTYNASYDPTTETFMSYDILDRQKKVILPTGDSTLLDYGFSGTQSPVMLTTTTTDANGNSTVVIKDGIGLQREIIDAYNNITSFGYNVMGELLYSNDPDGSQTDYEYDMLGQKVTRVHPDAGLDKWQYDLAGNMVSRQTQNLQNNNNQWIEYEYNYNQLTGINYPENPQNNVTYAYGAMGAIGNRAGKIVRQEDASGYQEFAYGKLGEITENIRTFVLPNETETYTFIMYFEYDSWNRIMNMTYPDHEVVNYHYNVGSLLKSMDGVKGSTSYNYIDTINYNKFEAKTGIYYGNGTYATYRYDILQRLQFLNSYNSSGEKLQDIEYTFDKVNNITAIRNVSSILNNGLGGSYESSYEYDNLYRLKKAGGYWYNGATHGYELTLNYSPDGRILQKTQTASQLLNGNQTSISYDNTYTYAGGQPHALSHVDDNGNTNQDFEWDANGNLIFHHHDVLGDRNLCWDEENRIMGVADEQFISYYTYDAGGERTYKLTGAFQDMIINGQQYNYNLLNNPTLYTSPYLVATPQGYTKHFYAGSERILSKIGCGGLDKIEFPINISTGESKSVGSKAASKPPEEPEPTPIEEKRDSLYIQLERTLECLEKDPEIIWDNLIKLYDLKEDLCEEEEHLYYYHPDHLGSGTWITYTDGSAIQHLHYLPFGEEQIDQRLTSFNSRYTFSAKEKDIETGYSYFGARYYTSDLSIWLSVDPLSDKSPSLSPYSYCSNNPVILVDPNGEEFLPYLIFNGETNQLLIFDDNDTPDDRSDDTPLGSYDAHNNVDSKSNGKWEDGKYEMQDKTSPYKHPNQYESDGKTPKDSPNGRFGKDGIYKAKNFVETMTGIIRTAMGIHAGREFKSFLNRVTNGCIRTTPKAMKAIQKAIDKYGPLQYIIVQKNRHSANSDEVNSINPLNSVIMSDPNPSTYSVVPTK